MPQRPPRRWEYCQSDEHFCVLEEYCIRFNGSPIWTQATDAVSYFETSCEFPEGAEEHTLLPGAGQGRCLFQVGVEFMLSPEEGE